MSDVTEAIERLSKVVTNLTKITVEQHDENRRRFSVIDDHVRALWRRIDGEEPPRGPNGSLPPMPHRDPRVEPDSDAPIPLGDHVSAHDLNLASLEGRVIVLDRKVDKMQAHVKHTNDMQEKQTKAMGIGLGFSRYLVSKEGLRAVGVIIAALAALLAAFNTSYSNYQQSKTARLTP